MSGLIALGLLFVVLATAIVTLHMQRLVARRRATKRQQAAKLGEQQAKQLLERWGHRIVAEQARFESQYLVDGEPCPFTVSVDFVTRFRGHVCGVEVKTGASAPSPRNRATRRQLREYAAVLPIDALYLLDMERQTLQRISFSESPYAARGKWMWGLWGVCAGLLVSALLWLVFR
jgi:Holliday junction resolvase-like predicted endonuclease